MDPFTALGLASNLIQFVDFAWKLVTETREIAMSADGSTESTRLLGSIMVDIISSNRMIEDTITEDPNLKSMIKQCGAVSLQLVKVLDKLKVDSDQSRWASFTVALKSVWKKKEIEGLYESISRLRQRVFEHLEIITLAKVSGLVHKVASIDSALTRLDIDRQYDYQHLSHLSSNIAEGVRGKVEALKLLDDIIKRAKRDRQKQDNEWPAVSGDIIFELESVQKMVDTSAGVLPPTVVTAMKEIQTQGPEYESDLEFLESLHFPDIKTREQGIKDAQFKTFEWILEPEKYHQGKPAPGRSAEPENHRVFADWLERENGIFWVHGKPGCGKSTLMKFICSNPKTEKRLRIWAAPKKLAIAHYFFWRAGSELQKTQKGLLRSLVFEMIRVCPDLLAVAKATVPEINIYNVRNDRWTKDQLLLTYKAMVSETLNVRFCFFIDGLDEYYDSEKNPEDLVNTIRELDLSNDVKLCISSRPYPIFMEQFCQDQNSERVLKVEDYTRGDIRQYVEERFKASGNFVQLQQIDNAYADFVDEVSDRAQGVFLWVVLVVADLEGGIKNGDSVHKLRKRLNSYPPDLDEFFLQMLKNIDAGYRKQAMRTFEMVTSALRPLHAMLFWYLYEIDEDPKGAALMRKNTQPLRAPEVKELLTQLRRQLQARSRGLLEIVEDGSGIDSFFTYKLDFIHRTVRDFLRTSEAVKAQFRSELIDEPRTTWNLACFAIHSLLQVGPYTGSHQEEGDFMHTLIKDLYYYTDRARHCQDRSVSEEEAKRLIDVGQALCDNRMSVFNRNHQQKQQLQHKLFLCLDAQYNFPDNLKKRINKHGKSLKINGGGGENSVLEYALVELPSDGPLHYSEEIVRILLKNGAEPNSAYQGGTTVWQQFIVDLSTDRPVEAPPPSWRTRIAILKLILEKNDKLLQDVVTIGETPKTVEAVLCEILPKDEMARIPHLKKKQARWFRPWLPR